MELSLAAPLPSAIQLWKQVDGISGYILLGIAFGLSTQGVARLGPAFFIAGPGAVGFTLPFLLVASHSLQTERSVSELVHGLTEAVASVGRLARALIPVCGLFLFASETVVRAAFLAVFCMLGALGLIRVFGAALPPSRDATECVLAAAWTGLTGVVGLALYLSWMAT